MADQKISELTNITGANLANADEFVVVDVSADQTKAVTRAEFFKDTPNITTTGTLTVSSTAPTLLLAETDTSNQHRIIATGGSLYIQAADSDGTTDGDLHLTGYTNADLNLLNIKALTTAMNGDLTATGTVTAGDVNITGPTPVLTLTDNDVASEYTRIENSSGATFITSRNGAGNGAIILSGQGGGSTDEYARFNSSGNFGIGTTTPSSHLHVNSGIYDTIATFESGDRYGTLKLRDSTSTASTGGVTLGVDGDGLYIQTGSVNSNAMLIDANGQLNVNNNDIIGVDQIRHHGDTDTYIQFHEEDQFRVVTGGSERLEVSSARTQINQDVTMTATGTTATSTRKLSVQSIGYAVLELSGDRLNSTGETGGSGMTMFVDGTNPNGIVSFLNAAGTNGVGGSYTGTGSNNMLVGTVSAHDLAFGRNNSVELVLGSTAFRPATNGTRDLGNVNFRWQQLYAATTTIATSDATTKQDVEEISEAEARVALVCKGLMRKFRFIDAVEKKGEDARIHFGIMAQDLQAAFADEGLDAARYAMFCSDTWFEEDIVIPARDAVEEVLDDEGNVTTEARDAVAETTQRKVYEDGEEVPDTATEVTRLGVRYSELLAFIISAI